MKVFSLLILAFFLIQTAEATHIRGGRIEVNNVSGFTYEIVVITYTTTASGTSGGSLDSVQLGDTPNPIPFYRDTFVDYPNDVRLNYYIETHTYPGPGVYKIYFKDPNRIAGISNIPNSVATPFCIETEFTIDSTSCADYSPHLYTNPILIDHPLHKDLFLSRAGEDKNWDSISYSLVICLLSPQQPIVGYSFPIGISIDPVSGVFKWEADSMYVAGTYNFAVKVTEWRNNLAIGYLHEEFEVQLSSGADSNCYFNTNNLPVDLTSHLIPGDTFNLHIEYTDTSNIRFGYYSDLTNWNWNQTVANHICTGDLSFISSANEIRSDPYRILFNGRTDLTYLVYVDGIAGNHCLSVGTNDQIKGNKISIFPNPTQGILSLDYNFHKHAVYDLFDAIGNVYRRKVLLSTNQIDISELTAGLYIILIYDQDSVYQFKIIKSN